MLEKKVDICSIGELLIDLIQSNTNEANYPVLSSHPGGAPFNFAAVNAKYGLKCKMISAVGNDQFGYLLNDTLKECKIDTSLLQFKDDSFTTLAFVTLDDNGDRSFSFARKPGADTQIELTDEILENIKNSRLVHYGSLSFTNNPSKKTSKEVIRYALENNVWVNYDPNYRSALWSDLAVAKEEMIWGMNNANSIKISLEEVEFIYNCSLKDAVENHLKKLKNIYYIFITDGANGVYLWHKNNDKLVHIPGFVLNNTIDTTGAGDIFGGLMIYQILNKYSNLKDAKLDDLKKMAIKANAGAALSTTKHGAINSIPEYDEIINFLKNN